MHEITDPDHPFVARVVKNILREFQAGKHFLHAAENAGISEDLALQLGSTHPDLIGLLEQSHKEKRKRINELVGTPSPRPKTTKKIKHEYLKDLAAAGLFDKSVDMVRRADPNDEAGARVIEGHLRFVVKDLWPRESEHTEEVAIEDATQEELEKKLKLIRERKKEAKKNILSATKALEERKRGSA
jgi:hypothetical protein